MASATIKRTPCVDAAVGCLALSSPAISQTKGQPLHDSQNAYANHETQANRALFPGRRSLHIQKHTCSSCGYPAAKIRQCTPPSPPLSPTTHKHPTQMDSQLRHTLHITDNWGMKAKRRKTTGTGRMRYMKDVPRKFKNGFQTGAPKGARGTSSNPV